MAERPIIFGAESVRAILAGRKTQTRRVVKWPILGRSDGRKRRVFASDRATAEMADLVKCSPYGRAGERLWVRETWIYVGPGSGAEGGTFEVERADPANHTTKNVWYRASMDNDYGLAYRTPIFMPRWASRLTLEVTEVRVERLRSIREADAVAEIGCVGTGPNNHRHVDQYRRAWDALNAKCGFPWESNPFVWAVSFRRLQ